MTDQRDPANINRWTGDKSTMRSSADPRQAGYDLVGLKRLANLSDDLWASQSGTPEQILDELSSPILEQKFLDIALVRDPAFVDRQAPVVDLLQLCMGTGFTPSRILSWTGVYFPKPYLVAKSAYWVYSDVLPFMELSAKRGTGKYVVEAMLPSIDMLQNRDSIYNNNEVKSEEQIRNHLEAAEELLAESPKAAFMVAAVRQMILGRGPSWLETPANQRVPEIAPAFWRDRPEELRLGRAYQSPSDFIRQHYKAAYDAGVLGEDDIRNLDLDLYRAYKERISRKEYREEALPKLLPPDSSVDALMARLEPFATREELKRLGAALIQQDARQSKKLRAVKS